MAIGADLGNKYGESYKIAVDLDEFFRIFEGDSPEARKWLEVQLLDSDGHLFRRLIRIFTDSCIDISVVTGQPRSFATRISNAVCWLDTLERGAYDQGWDDGRRALQQEISEKLGLL